MPAVHAHGWLAPKVETKNQLAASVATALRSGQIWGGVRTEPASDAQE